METLLDALPEAARDLKLNLQAVLGDNSLTEAQRYGVALASAFSVRNPALTAALLEQARSVVAPEVIDDAKAAAAMMGMTNVFYRFRHLVGKTEYESRPPRLRMNRMIRTAGPKVEFELYCLAVSAINACEACVRGHERTVLGGGLTEDHVNDAVRIAATVHAVAVALEMA